MTIRSSREDLPGFHHDGKARREDGITVGVLEGKVFQAADLVAVAKLPKKEVLIAMLLSAMQGPVRGVVYALSGV